MKYICKKDLPFVKKGEEFIITNTHNISELPEHGRFMYEWPENWGPIEDWFEPKRWKPEVGEEYWVINFYNSTGKFCDVVVDSTIMKETTTAWRFPIFQTKAQAEKARLLVLEALKKAHE